MTHALTRTTLSLALGASLLLSACTAYTGGSPLASENFPELNTRQKGAITFSFFLNNGYGEGATDAFITHEQVLAGIQTRLQTCGMFSEVRHVSFEQAGPRHLHFDVNLHGPANSRATVLIGGLTLFALPTYQRLDMTTTMTVSHRGTPQTHRRTTHSKSKVLWVPLLLCTPYYNDARARRELFNHTMDYFLQELYNINFD